MQFVQENEKYNYKLLYESIREVIFAKRKTPQMQPKAILFNFNSTLPDETCYKPILEEFIQISNFDQGESFLRDLTELIAVDRGLLQKRVARDHAIGRIARTLVHLQSLQEDSVTEIEDPRIAHQVEDLREAVEIARQGLKSLQMDIEKIDTEAQEEAFISVFQEMNTVKHSYFLDQFLRAEIQLEESRQLGTELPQEIELISVLIPIFNHFLRLHDVQPKELVGKKIPLSLKESDHYEYIGSDFESSDEQKTVEVLSPGWTCRGRLIIKPRVREVDK